MQKKLPPPEKHWIATDKEIKSLSEEQGFEHEDENELIENVINSATDMIDNENILQNSRNCNSDACKDYACSDIYNWFQ